MSYLSPVAHAISSGEAPKGGKFAEGSYMDISFLRLRLPSHILGLLKSEIEVVSQDDIMKYIDDIFATESPVNV